MSSWRDIAAWQNGYDVNVHQKEKYIVRYCLLGQ